MKNKIAKFIEECKLDNKTLLVGFSGGFDSMCLLNNLADLTDKYKLKLIACHYNHNWRGKKAKQEQEHCRQFCSEKNIEFYTETAPDNAKQNETEARELRYDFFYRALNKFGADAVLTAHNFDDNAETILYRIIKGTGIVGLKGILPKRDVFYRPLLNITREEIENYCRENNLSPNNDESNNDVIHKRNLIRHDIFPLFSEINPDFKNALNSLGEIAISESDIIDEYLNKITKNIIKDNKIDSKKFFELSNPLKQKIIYNLIYDSEFDYTKDTILNICEFIDNTIKANKPSKFSLGKNGWLYADTNIIEIIHENTKNSEVISITNDGKYSLGDCDFYITSETEYKTTTTEDIVYVDLSGYNNLYLRTRRDGDVIQPLGSSGHMKLKKYLMSKKIPQHERDSLVLLTDEKEILWVAGIGLSDKIKTSTKTTHVLKIKKRGKE